MLIYLIIDSYLLSLQYRRLLLLRGTTVKAAVKYIMDGVMNNEMQTKFNWEGRIRKTKEAESKTGFKKSNISAVVTKVLLANSNFTTTEDEIGHTIMMYLRNAADRCGGRSRRQQEAKENS